jgi:hypothetical protein
VIPVTAADLRRLLVEVSGDKQQWLDERGIDRAAMVDMAEGFKGAFIRHLFETQDLELSLDGCIGFAFQVGFETCAQLRQSKPGRTDV